jgi:hypothetical protein
VRINNAHWQNASAKRISNADRQHLTDRGMFFLVLMLADWSIPKEQQ